MKLNGQDAKNTYVKRWESHINELGAIIWNISDPEDYARLNKLQEELKSIVSKASLKVNEIETY